MDEKNNHKSALTIGITLVSEKASEMKPAVIKIHAHTPTADGNYYAQNSVIYPPPHRSVLTSEPAEVKTVYSGDILTTTITIPNPTTTTDAFTEKYLTSAEIGHWDSVEIDVILGEYIGPVTDAYVSEFTFSEKTNFGSCAISKNDDRENALRVNLLNNTLKPYCESKPVEEDRKLLGVDALPPLSRYHCMDTMLRYVVWQVNSGDTRSIEDIANEWREKNTSDIDDDVSFVDGAACDKKFLSGASCEHLCTKYIGGDRLHSKICDYCHKYISENLNPDTVTELCVAALPHLNACIRGMHGVYDNKTIATVMLIFAAVRVAPQIVAAVCDRLTESEKKESSRAEETRKAASNACEAMYMEN